MDGAWLDPLNGILLVLVCTYHNSSGQLPKYSTCIVHVTKHYVCKRKKRTNCISVCPVCLKEEKKPFPSSGYIFAFTAICPLLRATKKREERREEKPVCCISSSLGSGSDLFGEMESALPSIKSVASSFFLLLILNLVSGWFADQKKERETKKRLQKCKFSKKSRPQGSFYTTYVHGGVLCILTTSHSP